MTTSIKNLAILAILVAALGSCSKKESVEPTASVAKIKADSVTHSPYREGAATTTVTARPTSVASSESTFGTYAGFRGVDYDGTTTLTITGTAFGSTTGTVSLSDANYAVSSISSWSDTRIVVRASSLYTGTVANPRVTVTVRPISHSSTTRVAGGIIVAFCSTIYSRQYLQCTWWCSARRADLRLTVQPRGQSYSATSGIINNNYVPQRGDIWLFGSAHQAFVESTSALTVDEFQTMNGRRTLVSRLTTYTVQLSEYNIRPEAFSSYTATVQIRTNVASGIRTRANGVFRSGYSSEATRFYR